MNNEEQIKYHKMNFIMNALEEGWKVMKKNDMYIFTKKHEGKKEVFDDKYLENFVKKNMENKLNK